MGELKTDLKEQKQSRTHRDTRLPPSYRVILLNDHYTTMDFVVKILEDIFRKPHKEAVRIMLQVHRTGSGVAGIYPAQIAEMKVSEVHQRARAAGFPLRCTMEPEG